MSDLTPSDGQPPEPPTTPCPGCHMLRPLNINSCPGCGLLLIGDLAVNLRQIDEQLYEIGPAMSYPSNSSQAYYGGNSEQLAQRYRGLLVERANTLAALYAMGPARATVSATSGGTSTGPTATEHSAVPTATTDISETTPLPPPPPTEWQPPEWSMRVAKPETSPRVVQNTLLTLGAILVGTAAIAFTIFAWGQLSIAGRGAILAVISLVTLSVPMWLVHRGLRATAETLVILGLLLLALDAYAAWHAVPSEFPGSINAYIYGAVSAAAIATIAVIYRLGVPLSAPRLAAVAIAHVIPPLLALGISETVLSLTLACLTVATFDIMILALGRAGLPVTGVCIGGAGIAVGLGFLTALTNIGLAETRAEAAADAGVAAGFAVLVGLSGFDFRRKLSGGSSRELWGGISAAIAPMMLWGSGIAVLIRLTGTAGLVLVGSAAIGLLAAVVAVVLPHAQRGGANVGAGIILGLTGVPLAGWVLVAAWAPVRADGSSVPWNDPATLGVRMLCAVVLVCTAWALLQWRCRKEPAGLEAAVGPTLVAIAVFTTTIGPIAEAPLPMIIALPLLGAIMITSLGLLDTGITAAGTFAAGLILATNAFTRGLVSPQAAIGALSAIVVVYAAIAVLTTSEGVRVTSATVGSAALLGLSAAIARAVDGDEHLAAYLLLGGVIVLLGVSIVAFQRFQPVAVTCESLAGLGAFLSFLLTVDSPLHSAVVATTVTMLLAGLSLLPPHQTAVWWALAAGVLSVALWLRTAEIQTVEAYTLPPALAVLLAGVVAHRRKPGQPSWVTFGPLLLSLGPTLEITLFGPPDPLRALILSGAALAITAIGAFTQRQAPFVIGAITIGAVAVRMVAPLLPRFTEHLPVWAPLAGSGLVLLIAGAGYERGQRDVKRLVGVILRMD